jgi:Tfp pilus assembly protein PilF
VQLQQGDRLRAREFFQRALAVDMKLGLASEERIAEHVLARAELARLAAP